MSKTSRIKTRKDLVDRVNEITELSRKDAEMVVDELIDLITKTLAEGGEVTINGFGKFEVRTRSVKSHINPMTQEEMEAHETRVPAFKPANKLKDIVKGNTEK